jgi:hypothetical protein
LKVLLTTIIAILLLALVLWRPWEESEPTIESPPTRVDRRPPPTDDPPVTPVTPRERAAVEPAPEPEVLSPEDVQKVRDAIDNLELTLRDFGTALGGNPVGTNAEITAALLGDNAKQVKLELPAGSSLNASGELCDPWGTPWFFHQISRTKTELRSAGPDRKLYTEDDFVR